MGSALPRAAKSKEESLSVACVCLSVGLSCVSSYHVDAVDRLLLLHGVGENIVTLYKSIRAVTVYLLKTI